MPKPKINVFWNFSLHLCSKKNSIYTSILVVLKTQKTMRLPPNNSTILLFVSEFRSLRKVWNEIYWLRTLGVLPIGWRRTPWGASRRVHFIPTDLARVRDIQLASFQGQHHVHPPQYQTTHSEPKSKQFPSPFGRKKISAFNIYWNFYERSRSYKMKKIH